VTSKLQLTVPKVIADKYGIRPGDELEWTPAGEGIRIELARGRRKSAMRLNATERLALFDGATKRMRDREKSILGGRPKPSSEKSGRGWTREELYEDRGLPR
jgi:bifunctional DNA-binding transcriptional regulator/antitoxin component of YhaV-PrlF toxin-antitoxin module